MKMYIGLDVHSKFSVFAAQDEEGRVVGRGKVPTNPAGYQQLVAQLSAPSGTEVALETGGQAALAAGYLVELGLQPLVIDAAEVRAKARGTRQKSDGRDAFELCEGLRRGYFSKVVYLPPANIRRVRELLSQRRHFVRVRTAEINSAKYLLRARGLGNEVGTLTTPAAWGKLLVKVKIEAVRTLLECHNLVWRAAQAQVDRLEVELAEALQPFTAELELLQSAPGVGPLTAATFLAVLATPQRFPDSSRVVSYAGLAVSTYNSGEAVRHGRITKQGSAELRSMLCEAAHQAARPTHPLNPYFTRICARSGYKKAVICVAQRLARILYQMWKKKERFDAGKLKVIPGPTVRQRLVYWRLPEKKEAARQPVPA